jgi:ABC-type Fe3+ transport system permease subunit
LVSGTTWPGALRKVTFPLIAPGFASGAALLFVLIFRDYPLAAFLSTSGNQVISMSLMGYNNSGQWNYVAVLAIFLAAVSTTGILVANAISNRFSIKARTATRSAVVPELPSLS